MSALKRISMAGADVAVTDATIADLVLEYAMHLGRADFTDIVIVPVPGDRGGDVEVDLLLGPASQIVLSHSDEVRGLDRSRVDTVIADLRTRIERVSGRGAGPVAGEAVDDPLQAFVNYAEYDDPQQRG